jgi:hypothetical protein
MSDKPIPQQAVALCDEFLAKLEPIPDHRWTTGRFKDPSVPGEEPRCCVMGHLGSRGVASDEALELNQLFIYYLGCSVVEVNDNDTRYTSIQSFPTGDAMIGSRGRVLTALRTIRAKALTGREP